MQDTLELGYRVYVGLFQENWPGYGIVTDPTEFRCSIITDRVWITIV